MLVELPIRPSADDPAEATADGGNRPIWMAFSVCITAFSPSDRARGLFCSGMGGLNGITVVIHDERAGTRRLDAKAAAMGVATYFDVQVLTLDALTR